MRIHEAGVQPPVEASRSPRDPHAHLMTAVSPGSVPAHPPVLPGLLRCLHPALLLGLPALLPGLLPGPPPLLQLQAHCARTPALQWVQQSARWEGECQIGQAACWRQTKDAGVHPPPAPTLWRVVGTGRMPGQPGSGLGSSACSLCGIEPSVHLSKPQVLRGKGFCFEDFIY